MDGTINATAKERNLSDEEIAEIRADLLAAKDEGRGMSWSALAREAGVADSTLSLFATDKYNGNNETVAEKVQLWLMSRRERAATRAKVKDKPTWQPTPSAKSFIELFRFAQTLPDIVVLAANPGLGKTATAEHYRSQNPNVFLCTMAPTTATVNTMLNEIAKQMNVLERSQARLSDAIGNRIKNVNALIIVDEAQRLNVMCLEQLRYLHDTFGVGLALVGNDTIYKQLEGGTRGAEFAQLFSRVGMRVNQSKPKAKDVCMLLDAWGVPDNLRKRLKVIASKNGALRVLTKTLTVAHMIAAGADEELAEKHIDAAYARLTENLARE